MSALMATINYKYLFFNNLISFPNRVIYKIRNYLGRLRNGISSLCLPLTLKGAKAENAWPSFRTESKPGTFSRIAK